MLYAMPKPYPHEEAARVIAQLQDGEVDGWTYAAVADPSGGPNSLIEVRDEDGQFVGYWKI